MKLSEESKSIMALAKRVNELRAADYDCVIAITGDEGKGKSSFAIRFANAIDPNFTLEEGEIFSADKDAIKEKIVNSRIKVFIMDEAIKLLYKLKWQQQTFLNVLYNVCRKKNTVTLLCIPRLSDLSEYFRNHRVRVWIHCIDRGHAVVFKKTSGAYGIGDVWNFNEYRKLEAKCIREDKDLLKIYRKFLTYKGIITWAKLPTLLERKYKKLSYVAIGRGLVNEGEIAEGFQEKRARLQRNSLIIADIKDRYRTQAEIAKICGIAASKISELVPDEFKPRQFAKPQFGIPPPDKSTQEHEINGYNQAGKSRQKPTPK